MNTHKRKKILRYENTLKLLNNSIEQNKDLNVNEEIKEVNNSVQETKIEEDKVEDNISQEVVKPVKKKKVS